jgi:NTE family protein
MGALQVGILRSLFRRGFRPGRVVGTSVGALNGAFVAFYPDEEGVDRLAEIWRGIERERFINLNPMRLAYRLALRQHCLFSNEFLERLVSQHAVEDDFTATKVPLHVTATSIASGRKRVFTEGPVSRAVLASTAIPGVFCPVEVDGEELIDGGVVANLDLQTAIEAGAEEILAIDLSHCFHDDAPDNVLRVITRTVDIVMQERVERDFEALAGRARIALLQPEMNRGPGVGDLRHVPRLIEQGEQFAEQVIDQCLDLRGRIRPGVVRGRIELPEAVDSPSLPGPAAPDVKRPRFRLRRRAQTPVLDPLPVPIEP